MSRPQKVLSPEQVKQRLQMQGQTITQWALAHGYTRNEVYRVLNGQAKAHYGKAHAIAVKLGMKPADSQPTSRGEPRNPQTEAA